MRAKQNHPMRAMLAAAAIAAFVFASDTHAADKDGEARLQELTVKLKEHEVADTRHAATTEIGTAEALRDKARTLTKKRRDRDQLVRTLDELEATLAVVGAKIVVSEADAKYTATQAKLEETKSELAAIRATADKLEKEQSALTKKLGGGQ